MKNLVLYLLINIILGRIFAKKMKIAAIFHSILFIVFSFLLMFVCDIPIISKASHTFFSDEVIITIRNSLLEKYRIYSKEISAFAVIEGSLLVTSIILVIIALVKGVKKIIEMFRKTTKKVYRIVVEQKVQKTEKVACRIYLKFCRLII